MALTKINASVIANNTIAVGNIADNSVDATKIASNSILTRHIDDNQIGIDQLNVSDGSNGQMLTTNGSGTLSFTTPSSFDADGAQVFNESGAAVDFRIEGDTEQNLFFVDGSADKIGIGTSSPAKTLHISSADPQVLRVESSHAYSGIEIKGSGSSTLPPLISALSNDLLVYTGHASTRVNVAKFHSGGHLLLETAGGYFQVAGSSSNYWGIGSTGGENTPGTASTTLGFHRYNGSAWNNAVEFDTNGVITPDTGTGGIKLGGAAAANLLDDYEEGTWTPVIYTYGGVTTTSSSMYGIYTKIGNICHIHCKISATLSSLPGQNWVITGLPFSGTNTNDANQRAIFAVGGDCVNTGGNTPKAHFRIAANELHGIYFNASNNTAYWTYNTMDSTAFEMNIHGFYITT